MRTQRIGPAILDRRIPEKTVLETEVDAWMKARNAEGAKLSWQFTTEDARNKLAQLYPQIGRIRGLANGTKAYAQELKSGFPSMSSRLGQFYRLCRKLLSFGLTGIQVPTSFLRA